MPTAKKLPSGSWRCQVFSHFEELPQPDGTIKKKRVYKSFTCQDGSKKGKRKCEQMAVEWAADKENKIHSRNEMTVKDALNKYVETKAPVLSPSTIYGYKRITKKLDDGFTKFVSMDVSRVRNEDVQEVVNKLCEINSPKTVSNVYGLISSVMKLYRPDFALHVSLPKKVRPNTYVPSDGDIERLMGIITDTEIELPVLLAAFGPMRRGEICALRMENISGTIVHVCENMVMDSNRQWVIKSPKSYAGDRYIDYPDFVADKWKDKTGRVTELYPDQVTENFSELLAKNGLPHFRFHDLRHYSASIQHALGVPDSYIMARGGWGKDDTLKSIYRHAMSEQAQNMNRIANDHFSELYHTKCNTD